MTKETRLLRLPLIHLDRFGDLPERGLLSNEGRITEDIGAFRRTMPEDNIEAWMWIRNPLPPSSESRDIAQLRRSLNVTDDCAVCPGDAYERLTSPDRARLQRLSTTFAMHHNPFIRHIVRRTREFLENTIDPETKEPFLKPVKV
jgi:hypothetical protein